MTRTNLTDGCRPWLGRRRFYGVLLMLALALSLSFTWGSSPAAAAGEEINTWTGAAGTDLWTDAGNWSLGRVPGPSDRAEIPSKFSVVYNGPTSAIDRLLCDGTLTVTGGTLELLNPSRYFGQSEISNLNLFGGCIKCHGYLVLHSTNWLAGGFSGPGEVTVAAMSIALLKDDDPFSDLSLDAGVTLTNTGLIKWWNGNILLTEGSELKNAYNGKIECEGGDSISGDPKSLFTNTNSAKIECRSDAVIDVNFQNTDRGTVQTNGGTLQFDRECTEDQAGTFIIGEGTLEFSRGSHVFGINATIEPSPFGGTGTMKVSGNADVTFKGNYNVTRTVVTGSRARATWTGDCISPNLEVQGGMASFHKGSTFEPVDLILSGGAIVGTRPIRVTGSFDWQDGHLIGPSTFTLASDAQGTIAGEREHYISGRTFINQGTLTWISGLIKVSDEAMISNEGTFDIRCESVLESSSTFQNKGTLKKTDDTRYGHHTRIYADVANDGIIEVKSGSYALDIVIEGNYVQSGAGVLRINVNYPIPYAHLIKVSGGATLAGALDLPFASGFVPSLGDIIQVLTYGTCSGQFDTVSTNLQDLSLAANYDSTELTFTVADQQPPKWPGGGKLTADDVLATSLNLSWLEASNNDGAVDYRIYQDGRLLTTLQNPEKTGYTVTGLSENSQYTFKVEAGDAAGNWTDDGPSLTVRTGFSVKSVALSETSVTLPVGNKLTLSALFTPADAADKRVSWSYTQNGTIRFVSYGTTLATATFAAEAPGESTITVTTTDGGFTATCTVTVIKPEQPIPVVGVTLDQDSISLDVGDSHTLTAAVSPTYATNKNVTWSTSNSSVATVEEGVVTAVGTGTATITVTTEEGEFTDTCTVTVSQPTVAVTGVSLSHSSLTLNVSQSSILVATVSPANATNKNVTWSSSDEAIATISPAGLVRAEAPGTATITVTTEDGRFTDTCTVTVNAATPGDIIWDVPSVVSAGDTVDISFGLEGVDTCDTSVSIRVRNAATNKLICGFTYNYGITFDEDTSMYHQLFDTAQYKIQSGTKLKIMVYFGGKLKGTAYVDVT